MFFRFNKSHGKGNKTEKSLRTYILIILKAEMPFSSRCFEFSQFCVSKKHSMKFGIAYCVAVNFLFQVIFVFPLF